MGQPWGGLGAALGRPWGSLEAALGQPHFPPFSCSQINASCLCGFETAMLQEKVFHPIGKAMIINFSTPKGGSVKMTALLTG